MRGKPLLSVLRRFWTIRREEGWVALWFRILGETVYRRVLFFSVELDDLRNPPAGITSRWLRAEEADAYAAFNPTLSAADVQHLLGRGYRCLIMEAGGRTVYGEWVATKQAWIDYLQMPLDVPDRTAYIFGAYTAVEERGKGYGTAAASMSKRMFLEEGLVRRLFCLQPDRGIAYPPVLKNPCRPIYYRGWFGLGPWRIPFRRATKGMPFYAPRLRK